MSLENASQFCEVVVLKSRTTPNGTTLSLRIARVIRRGAQAMYKRGATEPIKLSRGRQLTARAWAQSGSAGSESEDSMGSLEANFNHMGREAKMPVSPKPYILP